MIVSKYLGEIPVPGLFHVNISLVITVPSSISPVATKLLLAYLIACFSASVGFCFHLKHHYKSLDYF